MKTRTIHAVAGTMILISLLLGIFVQLNLFQSAFTNWCLLGNILEKFGIKDNAGDNCCV